MSSVHGLLDGVTRAMDDHKAEMENLRLRVLQLEAQVARLLAAQVAVARPKRRK